MPAAKGLRKRSSSPRDSRPRKKHRVEEVPEIVEPPVSFKRIPEIVQTFYQSQFHSQTLDCDMCDFTSTSKAQTLKHIKQWHIWLPNKIRQDQRFTMEDPQSIKNVLRTILDVIQMITSQKNHGPTISQMVGYVHLKIPNFYDTFFALVESVVAFGEENKLLLETYESFEHRYTLGSRRLIVEGGEFGDGKVRLILRTTNFLGQLFNEHVFSLIYREKQRSTMSLPLSELSAR